MAKKMRYYRWFITVVSIASVVLLPAWVAANKKPDPNQVVVIYATEGKKK